MMIPGSVRYKYNSADNHLNTQWLPRNMWQERVGARSRERAPRVVETDSGSYWCWEGRLHGLAADGSSNPAWQAREFPGVDLEAGRLPPSEPDLVLAHMDTAGIYGAVFFGDTRKWMVEDPLLRLEMYRAYNDFCLELSAHAPDRLIYLPMLSTADPQACLPELRRVAELGARGVEFGMFDLGAPLHDPVWEPLWEEIESRGLVLCSHTGNPAGTVFAPNDFGQLLAHHSTNMFGAAGPISRMVFSGVFERHPRLKWIMAECRIGWLPFLFSWMDRQIKLRPPDATVGLRMLPSEYIRRNVCFTFEEDRIGGQLLREDWSGLADVVIWGCDYPHAQGPWPDPAPVVDAMFDGLDARLAGEILLHRTARLFGISGRYRE